MVCYKICIERKVTNLAALHFNDYSTHFFTFELLFIAESRF